jgi:hypothetical protein
MHPIMRSVATAREVVRRFKRRQSAAQAAIQTVNAQVAATGAPGHSRSAEESSTHGSRGSTRTWMLRAR